MKRGDIVTVAVQGDYGKPRPALVIQSDFFENHPSVTVLPITSELRKTPLFRINVTPDEMNGLRKQSQIMIDKALTVARNKIGDTCGHVDDKTMIAVNRLLALFLGFA